MLDYRFIKDNLGEVKKNIAERYMDADADLVVSLYDEKNSLQREVEELRKKRNFSGKWRNCAKSGTKTPFP